MPRYRITNLTAGTLRISYNSLPYQLAAGQSQIFEDELGRHWARKIFPLQEENGGLIPRILCEEVEDQDLALAPVKQTYHFQGQDYDSFEAVRAAIEEHTRAETLDKVRGEALQLAGSSARRRRPSSGEGDALDQE